MVNLVYTFDDNYAMQAGVSLLSLFENNRETRFHLFVIGDKISQVNIGKLTRLVNSYSNEIDIIEMPDFEKLVGFSLQMKRWAKPVFSKLFFCELLPQNIDKVIYLDTDLLIVEKIDFLIEELQKDWTDDCYAMGCISVAPVLRHYYGFKENEPYFGSGFFLIDLKKWRSNGIQKLFVDEITRRKGQSVDADQSIINCVLINKIKVLPAQYNVVTNYYYGGYDQYIKGFSKKEIDNVAYTEEEIDNAVKNPVIVHFLGENKALRPWYANGQHPMKEVWLYYWRLTEWNDVSFPDYPIVVKPKKKGLRLFLSNHVNLKEWLKIPFVAQLCLRILYGHTSKLYR